MLLEFEHVTKLYGTVIGVNDISLKLEPGAYGLLGPNGSGKTTLINLVIGQLRPTIGSVSLFRQDPYGSQELLRQVGICPAVEPHVPRVTAIQWVTFLVQLHGFSHREAKIRAAESLETVGMTYAMNRPMNNYSLGMRQRTKLAQAIAHDPELLILDEPFNGLDPVARHDMTEYLKRWIKNGKSLILASHILHEVEAVDPSFLLMSSGRLLASGSPSEVRTIMSDCPNTIMIRSSDRKRLASEIACRFEVDSIEMLAQPDCIQLSTRAPLELYRGLPAISQESGIIIEEMRSAEDSLQHVFTSLMRMHRGEI